ncbi:helix-turn-helix transcriptional regulator [Lactobacillus sp.]|uniref:helix-turn-helix domain-containing protein n=1 Tax=Lactobacillus sp. TaxID=1591 RepID=UPI0019B3616C|nr:helix-turn-helix transcriptional regulator [Lactobacillus sp.]MBD5430449.1 helix-turn-helix transcriptional regulator [Lactobacillus sp.]
MTSNQNKMPLSIGQALKTARIELGLTQKEMAAGIISTSYYSKVENGKHEIDAESLFKILHIHNYPVRRFEWFLFQNKEAEDNNNLQIFRKKLTVAQNTGNKEVIDEVLADWKTKKYSDEDEITMNDISVAGMYASVQESNRGIPEAIKKAAKKESWTKLSIVYFAQSMMLFDIDECYILVNSIINSYDKGNLDLNTIYDEVAVNLVIIDYCDYCQLKNVNKKYVEKAIDFLKTFHKTPDFVLIGYSILGVYYEALFNHDMEKARMIKDILVEGGMDWSIRRSIKKLEE